MSLAWLLVTQAFVYHITRYSYQYNFFLSTIRYGINIQLSSVAKCGETLTGGFRLLNMGVQVSKITIGFHPAEENQVDILIGNKL